MKVFVIRHGESETNLSNCWTGWSDVPLTKKGYADAQKARALLDRIEFDKIYSSDLSRAVETAKTVLPDCEIETTPLVREIKLGSLEKTPILPFSEEQKNRISSVGYADFGGETFEQFNGRIKEFIKTLETLSHDTVAVFCHAGAQRSMLDIALDHRFPRNRIRCKNCAIMVLEFTKNTWVLESWINLL